MHKRDRERPQPDKKPKRPYQKPLVEETGDFERLVLTCNHKPGPCGSSPAVTKS